MSDHPALQPVLRRADVTRLLASLEAARTEHINIAERYRAENLTSTVTYHCAVTAARATAVAHRRVTQAWEAAVIAADAANANLDKEDQ